MNKASLAMAAENMKDMMPEVIRYAQMIGEINAAHFKTLIDGGVPENQASFIVSFQPLFPNPGTRLDENEED